MAVLETKVDEAFISSMNLYREPDKSVGLIEACSKNVVVFAQYMLGLKLYSWQVDFMNKIMDQMTVEDGEREFVALTSRQIGKSTALAVFSIWCATFNKYPGTISNNTSVGIASASDVQAKKLLYEMKKFMRIGDRFMETQYKDEQDNPTFGESFFSDLLDENEPNNTTTITFKPYKKEIHGEFLLRDSLSGSVIKSYPPTSVVLGETFSVVIIDEAGKSEKITDVFFYDYMYPTGNSTNALRIYTSTPWQSSGFFYRMVDPDDMYGNSPAIGVLYTVDAIKIEAPAYFKNVTKKIDELLADGKLDEVQRAYYCRFVKGELSYFDPTNIFNMFDHDFEMRESFGGKCDLGVDFGGQTKSKSVLTVSYLDNEGNIVRVWHKRYDVKKDDKLIEDIQNIVLPNFNIQRIIPDDCPQGDFMIRRMMDLGWNVHPMNFKSDKVKKYGAFRSMLKRGRIMSYPDEDLKTEMLALENSERARNSVINPGAGYNDDLIDSFVMSCYFFLTDDNKLETFDMDHIEKYSEDYCPKCKYEGIIRKEDKGKVKMKCNSCKHEWFMKVDSLDF